LKALFIDIAIVTFVGLFTAIVLSQMAPLLEYRGTASNPAILPLMFFPVAVISLVLVHSGNGRDAGTQLNLTMAAIAVKFLLPSLIALIWFAVLKNSTYKDILLFFIVYLSFGITTVLLILRRLRNQP
jgi:hypothetical protein